jgi:inorganic pyrophosphatase
MDLTKLPIGDKAPEIVNAVVEIPFRETNKYEFDKQLGIFKLSRPLFASVHYPGDYGFIPSTLSEDGDALDILILVENPTFPGCLVTARPVAVLDVINNGELDEKVLAVSSQSPKFSEVLGEDDLPKHTLDEIKHFFTVYKQLERKKTEVRGWQGCQRAQEFIRQSIRRFESNGLKP